MYLLIIIIIFIIFRIPSINEKSIKYRYKNLRNKLKTGDIILFSHNSLLGNLIKGISNTIYSHCAVVIKINKKLFLLQCDTDDEYDYLSKKFKNGVQLVSLDKIIRNNKKVIFSYLELKGKVNKKKIINFIKKTYNYEFELNPINVILNFLGFKASKKNKKMCSEYLSYFLCKVGILKKNIHSKILPGYFANKNITNLNYNYLDPILFKS